MATFRLDEQPWIPVVDLRGKEREVSLSGVFNDANDIASISGSPLEVAAILRLLLAIAHNVRTPCDLREWKLIWEDRNNFLKDCAKFVYKHAQRWDLFHGDRPFLQDRRLAGGTIDGKECRPATVEPVEPTFLNRGKVGTDPFVWHPSGADVALPPAQAARALLVTHAFAVGGTGTPNPLIPKDKSGHDDKYSKSSLLAHSVVAFLNALPLDQLLVLNLLCGVDPGTPGWHFNPVSSRNAVPCTGIADRYSRPAQAILLCPDDDGLVRRAVVTIGPAFETAEPGTSKPGDVFDDPMVPHVKERDRYKPLRLHRGWALWRSAHVLLANKDKPLLLVDQLQRLVRRDFVPPQGIGLRIVGIGGEPGKVKHFLWRDEVLPFGIGILQDDERLAIVARAVHSAQKQCNRLRDKLRAFAENYLGLSAEAANTGEKNHATETEEMATDLSGYGKKRERAEMVRAFLGELVGYEKQKRGKDTVTVPLFSDFWAEVAPMGERIACDDFDEAKWAEMLKNAADKAYRKAIDRLPPDARRFRAEFARAESA